MAMASFPGAVRKYVLLRRKADIGRAAFSDYWLNRHGPLLASLPEFWRYTSRYIQNHVQPDPLFLPADPAWDGVVECWQKGQKDYSRGFAHEPVYSQVVIPDEHHFLMPNSSQSCFAQAHVVVDGPDTGVKILHIVRARAGIDGPEFARRWRGADRSGRGGSDGFMSRVRRYVQNIIVPGSARPAERHLEGGSIDEYWFESVEAARDAFSAPGYRDHVTGVEAELVADAIRMVVTPAIVPSPK